VVAALTEGGASSARNGSDPKRYDAVGIGLGPSNLSLAALAEPLTGLRPLFLERRPQFEWHSGLMLPDARLQVSFLKDLVTLVDPTSLYSFVNFLALTGRLYRFLVLGGERVTRREYAQYYAWVARQLTTTRFGAPVDAVEHAPGRGFLISTGGRVLTAPNLVLGTGRSARVPACAKSLLGSHVLHSSEFLHHAPETRGVRVLVVGGGQSGAEIVAHLLDHPVGLPRRLTWASSRSGFLPLDDSPFVNEWFNPRYVEYFQSLAAPRRQELLSQQKLAGDGVSPELLARIYRRLYEVDFLDGADLTHRLLPCQKLIQLDSEGGALVATFRDLDHGGLRRISADVVVLATGYRYRLPACLDGLRDRLPSGPDDFVLRRDYSLDWEGPPDHRIFVQNGGMTSHGIADSQLSLMAWRSATILNSICGREVYATGRGSAALGWEAAAPRPAQLQELALPEAPLA
jgi:lysine N6-hydroxylase